MKFIRAKLQVRVQTSQTSPWHQILLRRAIPLRHTQAHTYQFLGKCIHPPALAYRVLPLTVSRFAFQPNFSHSTAQLSRPKNSKPHYLWITRHQVDAVATIVRPHSVPCMRPLQCHSMLLLLKTNSYRPHLLVAARNRFLALPCLSHGTQICIKVSIRGFDC